MTYRDSPINIIIIFRVEGLFLWVEGQVLLQKVHLGPTAGENLLNRT